MFSWQSLLNEVSVEGSTSYKIAKKISHVKANKIN